jgi:hypothetical protein
MDRPDEAEINSGTATDLLTLRQLKAPVKIIVSHGVDRALYFYERQAPNFRPCIS